MSVILALGSALCWGLSDFFGGIKTRTLNLFNVLLVSQGTGLVLLVLIVTSLGESAPSGKFLLFAAVAGLGEIFGMAALYRGLAVGTMSIVAPVASIAPVVPLFVGFALGEVPAPLQLAGLVLIIAGLFVTALKRQTTGGGTTNVGPSVLYGLISALGFGIFFVAMDFASESGIAWALLIARLAAVAALTVIMFVKRSQVCVAKGDLPVLVLIGGLIVSADFMYATAVGVGYLGVVAVLGALHTVVTIVLAGIFLRERVGGLQGVGIATCLCGVLAVTLG